MAISDDRKGKFAEYDIQPGWNSCGDYGFSLAASHNAWQQRHHHQLNVETLGKIPNSITSTDWWFEFEDRKFGDDLAQYKNLHG